jgi:hypothetical protein
VIHPADVEEFSEIGAYSAALNAATGEAVQVLTAAGGKVKAMAGKRLPV